VGLGYLVPDQLAAADGKVLDQVVDFDQRPISGRRLRAVSVCGDLGRDESRVGSGTFGVGPGGSEQAGVAGGKFRRTVARGRVIGSDPGQRGLFGQAALIGDRAPRGERAGGGKVEQDGGLPGIGRSRPGSLASIRGSEPSRPSVYGIRDS